MIYNYIKNSMINMWPLLVIILVTLITVRIAYLRHHRTSFCFYKEFWCLAGVLYVIMLYQLVTRVDINQDSGMNLVPFTEIMRYEFMSEYFVLNVLGNIAVFIPFGYIIATYIKPKRGFTNFIIAIIVSTTIEFVQLYIGRSFDVDDIILNTLGCVIGFLVYVGFKAIGRHLPQFLKSEWLNNLVCIIISICIILYVLRVFGVLAI